MPEEPLPPDVVAVLRAIDADAAPVDDAGRTWCVDAPFHYAEVVVAACVFVELFEGGIAIELHCVFHDADVERLETALPPLIEWDAIEGDDDDPDGVVGVGSHVHVAERLPHGAAERVAGVGAAEGGDEDAVVVQLGQQVVRAGVDGGGHLSSLRRS